VALQNRIMRQKGVFIRRENGLPFLGRPPAEAVQTYKAGNLCLDSSGATAAG